MSQRSRLQQLRNLRAIEEQNEELRSARMIILLIGMVVIIGSLLGTIWLGLRNVEFAVERFERQREFGDVPFENVDAFRSVLYTMIIFYGAVSALGGVAMVLFGVFLGKGPVLFSILALTVYVGLALGAIFFDVMPTTIYIWLIRVMIVVALAKAIQSAVAYQKAMARQRQPVAARHRLP